MSKKDSSEPQDEPEAVVSHRTLAILERLDSWAHVVVAVFFLLMATGVLIESGILFARQVKLIGAENPPEAAPAKETPKTPNGHGDKGGAKSPNKDQTGSGTPGSSGEPNNASSGESDHHAETGASGAATKPGAAEASKVEPSKGMVVNNYYYYPAPNQGASSETKEPDKESGPRRVANLYIYDSLELLSDLLFAVIILELLRTIITYLQIRDTQAIMKEFLIVGIISSIRKILLVGAESSLSSSKGAEFINESIGVVVSVLAILLMIGGLIMLRRSYGPKSTEDSSTPSHDEH